MATPRLCGRRPSQRLRPALPIEMFMWSGFDTAPTVRDALAVHQALLARVEANDDIALVAADDLRVGAGRARDLAALAELHLDIVDDRADRHVGERHGVARLHVDLLAGDHLVADREALRRQDVGQLAVGVVDQRDEGGAVRIVFEPLDLRRRCRTCGA